MGHVILKKFHIEKQDPYFKEYCRTYTDLPFLVRLKKQGDMFVPERLIRASDFADNLGQDKYPEWKTLAYDETSGSIVAPNGSIGFRWSDQGKWNIDPKDSLTEKQIKLQITLAQDYNQILPVAFPYFGCIQHDHFTSTDHEEILTRMVPTKLVKLRDGDTLVTTVFDLLAANYGIDRGFGGGNVASDYSEDIPYTPTWQEKITGVPPEQLIRVARAFASTASKKNGNSRVIMGAGINHWYHMDMTYRAIITILILCGCVGKSGGGWAHYVGQEKLRPQTGWLPLAFGLDWCRPPRQINSTSFFYAHSDQWRYEKLKINDILSPLADPLQWQGSIIDCNIRAERMGWLPSAPQLE